MLQQGSKQRCGIEGTACAGNAACAHDARRRIQTGKGEGLANVRVQHACDTIKAEAIEAKLVDPVAAIGQKESQHFPVAVIEDTRIPLGMTALFAAVEVQVVRAVEHVEPVKDVFGRMAVHNIQQDGEAELVGRVDEALELFWGAVAATGGEEGGDLIPEAGVVGMLLHGHELDSVVPQVLDHGEDVARELGVGADALMRSGDADVGLVDLEVGGRGRARVAQDVALLGRGVPEHGVVDRGHGQVLRHARDPGGDAVDALAAGGGHADLDLGVVRDGGPAAGQGGQAQGPVAVVVARQGMGARVPVVEVADQRRAGSAGGPLAVDDVAGGGVGMNAVVLVAERKVMQAVLARLQTGLPFGEAGVALAEDRGVGLEPGVVRDQAGAVGGVAVVGGGRQRRRMRRRICRSAHGGGGSGLG